ncbi:hypothetical protein M441DRAFT_63374 [Trichoderma asperellum CBS 433.97]|uniref:Uncharacterized protein n=1 Tax=Trichoderma asperellum (strain ATCC 204424 / CBS 433.97 / NBRC 101777) TaxID=1042311 RepID=A0A2T3ZMN2_TRIA4|nr:hypothetical protein M441DRAFT_63374 [Trichoderma asperellum CBS 433.97]PTB46069.1 hypothetical protein M441DRAFT_63374 [Trichoderma asperellum CBS 433.97]
MDLETRVQAEALLLKAARTYGVQVRRDEVQQHLRHDHYGAALAEWASLHLTTDNLLSPDELAIYSTLDRNGQVDILANLHDLSEVQGVTEDDIKVAIDELRRSTESITKQSETLRQQQDALSRLVRRRAENDARRRDLDLDRQSKAESERQRAAAEVEAASQSLAFRISDLEEQGTQAGSNLKGTLGDIFRADDKLLANLQKLGWELEQPDPDETSKIDKLRETCSRLVNITVETVRAKLDTTYMDTLVEAERSGRVQPSTHDEVKALEAEVDSLHSEIQSVAQMSVEQQHLEQALQTVSAEGGQSAMRTSNALEYINKCLDHLVGRLDQIQGRIETHLSHQAAAASLISTAKMEMAVEILPPVKQPSSSAPASIFPTSPSKSSNTPARKHSNTVGSHHHRRRSSGVADEPPLDTLMYGLSVPSSVSEETDGRTQIVALSKILEERSKKTDEIARNAQETFEMGALAQLNDTRLAIQLVRDSVLAESPFNEPRLVDPEISGSITLMAADVEGAKDRLSLVEGQRRDRKSEKRDEFVERWG